MKKKIALIFGIRTALHFPLNIPFDEIIKSLFATYATVVKSNTLGASCLLVTFFPLFTSLEKSFLSFVIMLNQGFLPD